jgi:hypothetical protein
MLLTVIVWVIITRRMRWAGHMARVVEKVPRSVYVCMEFCRRTLKERDHLKDLGIECRITLKQTLMEGMDWIHVDEVRNEWQAVVNMVMNI